MKYGYARVSTRQQDLEGQLRQLEEERCDRVYFEKITGTKSDRPEFQKLLQEIQTGDTLVVTKLDRFARSTQDALNTIKLLFGVPSAYEEFVSIRNRFKNFAVILYI